MKMTGEGILKNPT